MAKPTSGFVPFHHSEHVLSDFKPREMTAEEALEAIANEQDELNELIAAMSIENDDEYIRLLEVMNDEYEADLFGN